jgi:hypothetical protein
MNATDYATLQAGQPLTIRWYMSAAHVGDCAVYLSYDADVADAQKTWFKIWEMMDCKSKKIHSVDSKGVRFE